MKAGRVELFFKNLPKKKKGQFDLERKTCKVIPGINIVMIWDRCGFKDHNYNKI